MARCREFSNRYFLDGLSSNSQANVGWIFGLHDRPGPERPIFGTVRYLDAAGLERKVDIVTYMQGVKKIGGSDIKASHK